MYHYCYGVVLVSGLGNDTPFTWKIACAGGLGWVGGNHLGGSSNLVNCFMLKKKLGEALALWWGFYMYLHIGRCTRKVQGFQLVILALYVLMNLLSAGIVGTWDQACAVDMERRYCMHGEEMLQSWSYLLVSRTCNYCHHLHGNASFNVRNLGWGCRDVVEVTWILLSKTRDIKKSGISRQNI